MGLTPSSVALGLADGDTSLDIVTANESSDSVTTRTGSGDGTFFPRHHTPLGLGAR